MPLLMCPNDNGAMSTVERSGVHFDMCPTCRGVWLDRGELEKLMESARSDGPGSGGEAPSRRPPYPSAPAVGRESGERGEAGERGEYGERGEHGHGGHRRRSIFDIFD